MNTDLVGVDKTKFLSSKESELTQTLKDSNILDVIGDHADNFVKAFELLKNVLESYKQSTFLNAKFYRYVKCYMPSLMHLRVYLFLTIWSSLFSVIIS